MKRPFIEEIRADFTEDTTIPYYQIGRVQAICDYTLYLERRLNDVMLGCEVDDIPHKHGGIL
jgi:hypothetical protein